jgi:hypothetical protein
MNTGEVHSERGQLATRGIARSFLHVRRIVQIAWDEHTARCHNIERNCSGWRWVPGVILVVFGWLPFRNDRIRSPANTVLIECGGWWYMLANADPLEPIRLGRMTLICWECEAPTSHAVEVPIPALSSQRRTVRLCQSCYWSCYLPVTADVS